MATPEFISNGDRKLSQSSSMRKGPSKDQKQMVCPSLPNALLNEFLQFWITHCVPCLRLNAVCHLIFLCWILALSVQNFPGCHLHQTRTKLSRYSFAKMQVHVSAHLHLVSLLCLLTCFISFRYASPCSRYPITGHHQRDRDIFLWFFHHYKLLPFFMILKEHFQCWTSYTSLQIRHEVFHSPSFLE